MWHICLLTVQLKYGLNLNIKIMRQIVNEDKIVKWLMRLQWVWSSQGQSQGKVNLITPKAHVISNICTSC